MRPPCALVALLALAVSACVGPPSRPAQVARVAAPPPIVVPPKPVLDWRDLPETAGTWRYAAVPGGSEARFGPPDAPLFILRCDRAARTIRLQRIGAGAASLVFTTSYGTTRFPAGTGPTGLIEAQVAARDPFLDSLAFSRGRFSVEGGGPELVLPAWAEPSRVVEDCRG